VILNEAVPKYRARMIEDDGVDFARRGPQNAPYHLTV
jgi:hypothetical protein